MMKFIRDWTLPIAMLSGVAIFLLYDNVQLIQPTRPFMSTMVDWLAPFLIFAMLFVSFSQVELRKLTICKWHIWVMLFQIVSCVVAYLLVAPFNKIVAQAAMVCLLCPTATAGAVITSKLGGSAASVTSYTLVSNLFTTILAPALFPLVEPHAHLTFFPAFLLILYKIFPLLLLPFLTAFFMQLLFKKWCTWMIAGKDVAFYMWSIALLIVTGKTMNSLAHSNADPGIELWVAFAAMVTCVLQFFLGKVIGGAYHDRISGGQALGQKNTVLAIWMAYTFLTPLSSVGPGTYVLWQNLINSWQLWKRQRRMAQR